MLSYVEPSWVLRKEPYWAPPSSVVLKFPNWAGSGMMAMSAAHVPVELAWGLTVCWSW